MKPLFALFLTASLLLIVGCRDTRDYKFTVQLGDTVSVTDKTSLYYGYSGLVTNYAFNPLRNRITYEVTLDKKDGKSITYRPSAFKDTAEYKTITEYFYEKQIEEVKE